MEWPAHLPIVGGGGVTEQVAGFMRGKRKIGKSLYLIHFFT